MIKGHVIYDKGKKNECIYHQFLTGHERSKKYYLCIITGT